MVQFNAKLFWLTVLVTAGVVMAQQPVSPPSIVSAGPAGATQPESPAASPASQPISAFENRPIGGAASGAQSSDNSTGSSWLSSAFWSLGLVVGLILLCAYAVKRWMPGTLGGRQVGPFKMLARWSIATRQSLTLVQVGRRVLLLGVTPGQINTLAEVTDPAEIEAIAAKCSAGRSVWAEGFGQLLGRQQARMEEDVEPATAQREVGQLAEEIKAKLARLKSQDSV